MMFKRQIGNVEVSELSVIDKQIFETESKLIRLQEQRREIINRNNLNKVKDAEKTQTNTDRI